ncbi:hypothetical protein MUG91_G20n139 [Manis pentadactyla]|nr:hypothetical protein MUG91_G20n139 [Manis pentadactyla]
MSPSGSLGNSGGRFTTLTEVKLLEQWERKDLAEASLRAGMGHLLSFSASGETPRQKWKLEKCAYEAGWRRNQSNKLHTYLHFIFKNENETLKRTFQQTGSQAAFSRGEALGSAGIAANRRTHYFW